MRICLIWCLIVTVVGELITIICRIAAGGPATAILRPETHVLIRMHHMFWAIPVLIVAIFVKGSARMRLVGIAGGLILSDLAHHFVVLPLWVGNTGWHWP